MSSSSIGLQLFYRVQSNVFGKQIPIRTIKILHIFQLFCVLLLVQSSTGVTDSNAYPPDHQFGVDALTKVQRSAPDSLPIRPSNEQLADRGETLSGLKATAIISSWHLTDHRVSYVEDLLNSKIGGTFYDARMYNYSQFVLLPQQSAIYVVGNGVTIFKLDMATLFLLDSFTLSQPDKNNAACQNSPGNLAAPVLQWGNQYLNFKDAREPINILNSADGFTYISASVDDYLRIIRSQMPDWNGRINRTGVLVSDKSSVYISEPATILLSFETDNEIYFVLREKPNDYHTACYGTRIAPGVRCTQTAGSTSNAGTGASTVTGMVPRPQNAARLVRICKGDQGGFSTANANYFGTFAKSDLVCHTADEDGNSFFYPHITTAFWDNSTQRLYAVFTTETWAPSGSALCVYTRTAIEEAFNGPLLPAVSSPSLPLPNTFPNICQRFNSKNLTSDELFTGRRQARMFPYRYQPIRPLYERALLSQAGVEWIHLQAYDLPALPVHYHYGSTARTSLIWLTTKTILTKFALYEPTVSTTNAPIDQVVVCKLEEILIGQSLNVFSRPPDTVNWATQFRRTENKSKSSSQTDGKDSSAKTNSQSSEEIRQTKIQFPAHRAFIITNHQVLWLPLANCARFRNFDACTQSRDPHCGWSWPEGRCANGYEENSPSLATSWFDRFSTSVDRRHPKNAQCPSSGPSSMQTADSWSAWYPCMWRETRENEGRRASVTINGDDNEPVRSVFYRDADHCYCRLCLSQKDCVLGTQEVTNCTRHDKQWLNWSTWSPCHINSRTQTRQRKCRPNSICSGSSREQRICSDIAMWSSPLQTNEKAADLPTGLSESSSQHSIREGYSWQTLLSVAILSPIIFALIVGGIVSCVLKPNCFKMCDCLHFGKTRHNNAKNKAPSLADHSDLLTQDKQIPNRPEISQGFLTTYLKESHIVPAKTRTIHQTYARPNDVPFKRLQSSVVPSPISNFGTPHTAISLVNNDTHFFSLGETSDSSLNARRQDDRHDIAEDETDSGL